MKVSKHLRSIAILISTLSGPAGAQSVLQTILGAAPDGAPALTAALNNPAAVAADRNGNVYVALTGSHQVVRIDSAGAIWVVAGIGAQGSTGNGGPATLATLITPVALAIDDAGNLYIADSQANRVRRVSPDGVISAFAGTGTAGRTGDGGPAAEARLLNPSALAIDASGSVLIADRGNHVIRSVSPDGRITTVIGSGIQGSSGNDGPALTANLSSPSGLAIDRAGNIYVADTGNGWIRRITPDGVIKRYAGYDSSSPSIGFGGQDPTVATNASLASPTSIGLDSGANLYLVEAGSARVRRVSADGKIASYAGVGKAGSIGDGGLARSASLNVVGIAVDSRDNLLIADGVNNRVRIITAVDGIIETFAGTGIASYNPRGVVVNGDLLYFADTAGNAIRHYNLATGELASVAGQGNAGFEGDGGLALSARVYFPRGLALDKSGTLYIADSGNKRVRSVRPDGVISTVAGGGDVAAPTDGGLAGSAVLNEPAAVAVDAAGNLFVAEMLGHVVRKVTADGRITTVAGTGTAGSPDAESGVSTAQRLNSPQGLAFDSEGGLLIADTGNNRIRRLSADGMIATIAGSGAAGNSGDGGPAAAATLRNPADVTTDAYGNVYIADSGNHKIRRIGPDGIITTVAGTGAGGYNGDGAPASAYSLNAPSAIANGPGCSIIVADTQNQRLRRIWPAADYTISSTPPGLQVTIDGQAATTPVTIGLLPGTRHRVDAPGQQAGPSGTRYLFSSGPQDIEVPCGPARAVVNIPFRTQYALTVTSDHGGSVNNADAWQDAGGVVTLEASPQAGFVFAGWEGDCQGTNSCSLTMNAPRSVKANFAPAQVSKATIAGIVGAGLSTPAVQALSPNGIATVFGKDFAPAGTLSIAGTANLVGGKVSTGIDGVCVLVGGTRAPVLALTPNQINFQTPETVSEGTTDVQVVTGCGTANEQRSEPLSIAVQSTAPEFFYFIQTAAGQNPIAAVDVSTGANVGTAGLLPGATFAPARPGDVVTLYATGLGITTPLIRAGELPTAAAAVAGDVQVSIAGSALAKSDILYTGATPSYAGLYQINIRLPNATPEGNQPVRVMVNGFSSPTGAYITIGP